MPFFYLNYDCVNERLDALVNNPNVTPVKKERPIGYTTYGLPINHYTMGHGSKHIVVTGSYHAAEIITTIFVVHLMEELAKTNSFDANEYTIDFIPMVNPEGYLITTSMQDLYLNQGKTDEEKLALAKTYWRVYREDASKTAKAQKEGDTEFLKKMKGYQALFENVDTSKFLLEYPDLRKNVLDIVNKNNYPIGVCAAWSSNGNGIDLSQNVPFNKLIAKYLEGASYGKAAYSNIRSDQPGPVNCPAQDLEHFNFEKENLSLLNFLTDINAHEEVVAFFNYHSVMGKMYQRPIKEDSIISLYNVPYQEKLIENYVGSRLMREENAYDIIENEDPYNYINEYLRLRFGLNIQVELSRMGSNPIGPLADSDTFMNVTVNPNILAFKNIVNNLDFVKIFSKIINYYINALNEKRKNMGEELIDGKDIYRIIDKICQNNPSLYVSLKEELKKPFSYNSHVITHLFHLIEENLDIEETKPIKDTLVNMAPPVDAFTLDYATFINGIVMQVNDMRQKQNKEVLSKEQIENLVNNLALDYPDIFAQLKKEPNREDLYEHLNNIIDNQIKMGNLIK